MLGQTSGDIDINFGDQGKVTIDVGDLDDCEDIVIDNNDNIYFAGYTTTFGSSTNTDFIIGKLTSSGIIDSTFGVNGFYRGDFPGVNTSEIHKIELINDGIILFGSGINYGIADTQYLYVSKVLFDGTIDTSFADSGTFSGAFLTAYNYPGSIAIQPDGKILLCGAAFDSLTMQDVPLLGRLLPNGTPDTSFSSSGFKYWNMSGPLQDVNNIFTNQPEHGAGGFLNDILLLDNGNYLFSGFYYSGTSMHCLTMMIDSNANFDLGYGAGGYMLFQNNPNCLNQIVKAIEFKDKIMLAVKVDGNFITYDFLVHVIDQSGNMITSFTADVNGQKDVIKDMFVIDDQLILAGFSTLQQNVQPGYESDFFALAKFDSIGVMNNQFSANGFFTNDFNTNDEAGVECIFANNNKIVAGGYMNNVSGTNITDFAFMRIHNTSATDIKETGTISQLSVYPNPAEDLIHVRIGKHIKNIVIYSITGQQMTISVNIQDDLCIDVSIFPSGIYFMEVTIEQGEKITQKIMVK